MYSNFKDLGMKGLLSDQSDGDSDCEGAQDCKYGPNKIEIGHKTIYWRNKLEQTKLRSNL